MMVGAGERLKSGWNLDFGQWGIALKYYWELNYSAWELREFERSRRGDLKGLLTVKLEVTWATCLQAGLNENEDSGNVFKDGRTKDFLKAWMSMLCSTFTSEWCRAVLTDRPYVFSGSLEEVCYKHILKLMAPYRVVGGGYQSPRRPQPFWEPLTSYPKVDPNPPRKERLWGNTHLSPRCARNTVPAQRGRWWEQEGGWHLGEV